MAARDAKMSSLGELRAHTRKSQICGPTFGLELAIAMTNEFNDSVPRRVPNCIKIQAHPSFLRTLSLSTLGLTIEYAQIHE